MAAITTMTKTENEPSFLEGVNLTFDRAAAALALPPGLSKQIKLCSAVYQVRFPVKLDGELKTFTGWRAVHSEHRLPVKGGIRYAPVVDQEEADRGVVLAEAKEGICVQALRLVPAGDDDGGLSHECRGC